MSAPTPPTQVQRPWRATVRTIFAALVAAAAMAAPVYESIVQGSAEQATGWVAVALGIAGAITRVMAMPGVESWLSRFLPFLAADPDMTTRS